MDFFTAATRRAWSGRRGVLRDAHISRSWTYKPFFAFTMSFLFVTGCRVLLIARVLHADRFRPTVHISRIFLKRTPVSFIFLLVSGFLPGSAFHVWHAPTDQGTRGFLGTGAVRRAGRWRGSTGIATGRWRGSTGTSARRRVLDIIIIIVENKTGVKTWKGRVGSRGVGRCRRWGRIRSGRSSPGPRGLLGVSGPRDEALPRRRPRAGRACRVASGPR